MPIVAFDKTNPFEDGRQSDRALAVQRGLERYFEEHGYTTLPELTLSNGRRADLVALSEKGDLIIVEVKSSIADFRSDSKWPEYLPFCDAFYFATLADVPVEIFPDDVGLIVADSYGGECLRPSELCKMPTAKRKQMHLRFARASAMRLARCCAHAGVESADLASDNET